jgi:hypothetical protein
MENKECIIINFDDAVKRLKEKKEKEWLKLLLEKYYKLSDHLDDGYRPPENAS